MPVTESDLIGNKSIPNISKENTDIATHNNNQITASLGKDPNFNQVSGADVSSQIEYIDRGHEAGLINDTTHSSIVIRHNGQINLSASHYSQYKLNPSGKIVEQSMESVSMSNRRKVATNDLLMNEHKLNPYLYELADMRKMVLTQNDNVLGGNFCVMGSVLVKAWDRNLKRYMMIRRPARIPLFSTILNIPEINKGLGITDPLKIDEDILAKTNKGFQVNKVVTDSNSLIGKEGQDRAGGTNRGAIIEFGDNSIGTSTSGGTTSVSLAGNSNAEKIWNFLKQEGFTDQGAAGVIGNLMQESQCDPGVAEKAQGGGRAFKIDGKTGYGIVQWTSANRQQGLQNKADQMHMSVATLEVQLAFMKDEASAYGTWGKVKVMTDIHAATKEWHDTYEMSDDYNAFGGIQKRYDFADAAYKQYASK